MPLKINLIHFQRTLILIVGAICILLGVLVLVGWHTHNLILMQVRPHFISMQYNAAVAFLLFGICFLLFPFRQFLVLIISFIVGSLALLTLAQYIFHFNSGIDQLVMRGYMGTYTAASGRMPPNGALCFVLTSAAFIFLTWPKFNKFRSIVAVCLGLAVTSLALLALFGYLAHLTAAYGWGNFTRMSIHGAFAFSVIGIGILVAVWYQNGRENIDITNWLPWFSAFAILCISIMLWQALKASQQDNIRKLTAVEAQIISKDIQAHMQERINALQRMNLRWINRGNTPKAEWLADSNNYIKDQIGYRSIEWIDSNLQPRWRASLQGYDSEINFHASQPGPVQQALHDTLTHKTFTMSRAFKLINGDTGFLMFSPIVRNKKVEGIILGTVDIPEMLDDLLKSDLASGYALIIYDGDKKIYSANADDTTHMEDLGETANIKLYNINWHIVTWPTEGLYRKLDSLLPELTLTIGSIIAVLITLLIRTLQLSRRKTQQLSKAELKLQQSLIKLEIRNHEISLLNELNGLLQSCVSVNETFPLIIHYSDLILKSAAGVLFIKHAAQDKLFEPATSWGGIKVLDSCSITDCWALRLGQLHKMTDPANDLICKHKCPAAIATLCVPLKFQSEIIGILYFEYNHAYELTEEKCLLANMFAEQVGLCLANLTLRETLQDQSIHDALTGLYNRRYLNESLQQEIARAQRKKNTFGINMIDIDHFKNINDTFGHDAGDMVLQLLAKLLKQHSRPSDIICRFGGEEFVLYLPDTALEAVMQRAETLRRAVEELSLRYQGNNLGHITISQGVAMFPADGLAFEDLIAVADKALYQAKESGRNRVVKG